MAGFRIRYIEALFGFTADLRHVAVADTPAARRTLERMGSELSGTDDLVAIYVPEGTDDIYKAGNKRGRVLGAVRLLPMPSGLAVTDFGHRDWDGSLRWPYGWPCEVIFAPPTEHCPRLRHLVETKFGHGNFAPFVARFQHGPFLLEKVIADAVLADFKRFGPVTKQ